MINIFFKFMKTKEQQAKVYAEDIPFYQDRKQHAAKDFIAGWNAALRELSSIPINYLEAFLKEKTISELKLNTEYFKGLNKMITI